MKFLYFHGSFGSPTENWAPYLKNEIEKLGHQFLAPQLPVDNWDVLTERGEGSQSERQNLQNWMSAFDEFYVNHFLNDLQNEKIFFVGHSLGNLFFLHVQEKYHLFVKAAFFVSPFLRKLNGVWQIDTVNETFYKTDFDFSKIKGQIETSFTFYSDNDPYVPQDALKEFWTAMDSQPILISGGGHISKKSGFTEFPALLQLCKQQLSP
jgi:uncharacterized protein